jgi:hypothetical protein
VRLFLLAGAVAGLALAPLQSEGDRPQQQEDGYLSWTAARATKIATDLRVDGRVGGWFDTRILSTERSYNYKLRATWMTPEVIRATARVAQLNGYLTDDETKALVAEAEAAGDTVVIVEVDPREGSGVIPLDWVLLLQPKSPDGKITAPVRGMSESQLRRVKALSSVTPRDYSYSVFWVVFPLLREDGTLVLSDADREAELIVRIYEKEGRVHWPIPQSIRDRGNAIAHRQR